MNSLWSTLKFGSTVVHEHNLNVLVSHKANGHLHTELILFKHSSFVFYVLAVCFILLSGYQIPVNYQLRRKEIYFQLNINIYIQKKCESLLQSATAILLHWRRQPAFRKNDSYLIFTKCDKCYHIVRQVLKSSVIITKSDRTGVLMEKLPMNITEIIIKMPAKKLHNGGN